MQFETIEKKPINEMALPNSNTQSKKGVKGFSKSNNPKTILVGFKVTPQCKSFIDEYCKVNEISLTKLFLAGIECYSGYNGTNHEEIIQEIKDMIEDSNTWAPVENWEMPIEIKEWNAPKKRIKRK